MPQVSKQRSKYARRNKFSPEHTILIMQAIRRRMYIEGITRSKLAQSLDITGSTIYNWTRGSVMLSMHNLQLMADALDISPGEIVREAMR